MNFIIFCCCCFETVLSDQHKCMDELCDAPKPQEMEVLLCCSLFAFSVFLQHPWLILHKSLKLSWNLSRMRGSSVTNKEKSKNLFQQHIKLFSDGNYVPFFNLKVVPKVCLGKWKCWPSSFIFSVKIFKHFSLFGWCSSPFRMEPTSPWGKGLITSI